MNDRALRHNIVSMGGVANGFRANQALILPSRPRLWRSCALAADMADLKARLGAIIDRRDRTS